MIHPRSFLSVAVIQAVLLTAVGCNNGPAQPSAHEVAHVADAPAQQPQLPGDGLLFNGWGVTPAGDHVRIKDLALKMVVAPDQKSLVAVSAGYGEHGLSLIDMAEKRVTQFLPMAEAWNGLAFSNDGKRIFVSTGDKGAIQIFKYADGKAEADRAVKPDAKATATSWRASRCIPRRAPSTSATRAITRCGSSTAKRWS